MVKEFRLIFVSTLGLWCLMMLIGMVKVETQGAFAILITWVITFWLFLINGRAGILYWIFGHRKPKTCLRIGAILLLFVPLSLLYYPLGKLMWKHRLAVAETYPAKLELLLEDYKRAQGHYPDDLNQLPGQITLPPGLSYSRYAEQDGYLFFFPDWDTGFGFGGYVYDSKAQKWRYESDS